MTAPAATAALAVAVGLAIDGDASLAPCPGCDGKPCTGYAQKAERILAHDWTPAERAALAAAVLTPDVLAEALEDVWPAGSAGSPYIGRLGMPDIAAAILAALATRGEA